MKVVALIDPAVDRAQSVLKAKCDSFVVSAYKDTRIYKSLDEFIKGRSEKEAINAFVIGSPPMFRGSTKPGRDVELQILKHFPGVAMFIEKPVATHPDAEIENAFSVAKTIGDSGVICSVGWVIYK